MLFYYTNITLIAAALQEAGNKSMSQAVGIQAACPAGSSCSSGCALGRAPCDGVAAPAMLTAPLGKSSSPSAPFTGATLGYFYRKADAEFFLLFLN